MTGLFNANMKKLGAATLDETKNKMHSDKKNEQNLNSYVASKQKKPPPQLR